MSIMETAYALCERDITAPASLALSHLELLLQDLPEASSEHAAQIRRNILRSYRMLSNTRDSERIENGVFRPQPAILAVNALFDRIAQEALPAALRLGVVFTQEIAAGTFAHGDEDWIERVLWNLITNALCAASPGGEVTLAAMRDAGAVRFEVRDSGPGIDPEIIDALNTGRLSSMSGLRTARALLLLHRTDFAWTSSGSGTIVSFLLPASDPLTLHSRPPAIPFARGIPSAELELSVLPCV